MWFTVDDVNLSQIIYNFFNKLESIQELKVDTAIRMKNTQTQCEHVFSILGINVY